MPPELAVDRADYAALGARVRHRDVQRYRKESGPHLPVTAVLRRVLRTVVIIPLAAFLLVFVTFCALVMTAAALLRLAQDANHDAPAVAGSTTLMFAIALVCLALVTWVTRLMTDIVVRDAWFPADWRRRYRLHRFAVANGLTYLPEADGFRRSGVIFTAGSSPRGYDILSAGSGSDFEIGNFQYAGDWRSERALRRFGYFRLRLPGALPHLVLEARRNRRWFGRSNLPWRFTSSQVLSLEGDFDRYFRLHAPAGFERDALYLFTPDLMVMFMDRAADFDVEIVDDWMYVYSPRPFRMTDRRTYERLFAVLETVGRRTLDRSARYTQHQPPTRYRVPSRLIRSVRIGPIVIVGVYLFLLVGRLVLWRQ